MLIRRLDDNFCKPSFARKILITFFIKIFLFCFFKNFFGYVLFKESFGLHIFIREVSFAVTMLA